MKLSRPERTVDEAWIIMRAEMDPCRQSVHQLCITFSISTKGSRVTVVLVVTSRFAHSVLGQACERGRADSKQGEDLIKLAEGKN